MSNEHEVRMWPVTAQDRSTVIQTDAGKMITGGNSFFFATRLDEDDLPDENMPFAHISWQDGVIDPEKGANGVTCEAMADAIIGRLRAYQDSKFKCRENALAITAFEEARNWLTMRREERMKRGVLNTHQV